VADAPLIQRAADIAAHPFVFRHPLDRNAEVTLFPLSHVSPLGRTGVTLAHLAPGRSSYPQHRHMTEEEWIYLLSGTATLRLDDADVPLGAGDFAAFPAGGPAHKLTNSGTDTLVYLMGGEKTGSDVVDFPEQGKRLTFAGQRAELAALDAYAPFDFFARASDD